MLVLLGCVKLSALLGSAVGHPPHICVLGNRAFCYAWCNFCFESQITSQCRTWYVCTDITILVARILRWARGCFFTICGFSPPWGWQCRGCWNNQMVVWGIKLGNPMEPPSTIQGISSLQDLSVSAPRQRLQIQCA